MRDALFNPRFLRNLEQLKLYARRYPIGPYHGERQARRKGHGSDFFDFRPYVPGDDLRYVDWNMFARLDRLILKLFQAEQALCLHILVDTSKSMSIGSPTKLEYALRTAAAFTYIGLLNYEQVGLGLFDSALYRMISPRRGRKQMIHFLEILSDARAHGSTNLESALTNYALQSRERGLVVLISDMFGDRDDDYQRAIAALVARRFEVRVLQLLAPQEVVPNLSGDLKLVDVETGQMLETTADRHAIARYTQNFGRFCEDLKAFCSRHGVLHYSVTTDIPIDELLFIRLREGRFLR
jgi:uncharacterized protein (DUF58 family)